jgi:hypothetical protein
MAMPLRLFKSYRVDLTALLVVTIWGISAPFRKAALAQFDVLSFTALRFLGMLALGQPYGRLLIPRTGRERNPLLVPPGRALWPAEDGWGTRGPHGIGPCPACRRERRPRRCAIERVGRKCGA